MRAKGGHEQRTANCMYTARSAGAILPRGLRMTTLPSHIERMRSPIDALWNWSYEISQARLDELYAKAKRDQWNADVAIDWSIPVDPGGKILDPERMAFLKLAFFERQSRAA